MSACVEFKKSRGHWPNGKQLRAFRLYLSVLRGELTEEEALDDLVRWA